MKKNNSKTENKAATATKEVATKKATEKETKVVKSPENIVKTEDPLVDAQTSLTSTEKLPRKEKKRNKALNDRINITIPTEANKALMIAKTERRARHKEAVEKRRTERMLNLVHHKVGAAERALANYRKSVEKKEEMIAAKKEHIKSLTPEKLAELAKRRIARKEILDEQIVQGKIKKDLQLAHFIAEQAKRNVKKSLKKTSIHSSEDIARIKAECEKRKAEKKAKNIAAAKLAYDFKQGMTHNQYTIVTSFVRPDGTTFTENRRVLCQTVDQAKGYGKKMYEKYMQSNEKRSKLATKVGVYPDFGNDWGNSVYTAEATAKAAETVLKTEVSKETVQESKASFDLAVKNRKAPATKKTKAEKLMAKYAAETKAAA